jgi:hypothetical protein
VDGVRGAARSGDFSSVCRDIREIGAFLGKTETLRFLTGFDVPFTNTLAGQDLRMMKVRMKISGCFRTLEGAQIFARLRSIVSTIRRRRCNARDAAITAETPARPRPPVRLSA